MTLQGTESNTLSRLREYLGSVQASKTCISIQVSSVVSVDHRNMLILNTIGACALVETFKEAAMLYTWTNGYLGKKNYKIAHEALAFIQSTGLEIMIQTYRLDFDAQQLRDTFFRTFHVKSV